MSIMEPTFITTLACPSTSGWAIGSYTYDANRVDYQTNTYYKEPLKKEYSKKLKVTEFICEYCGTVNSIKNYNCRACGGQRLKTKEQLEKELNSE